MSLTATHRKEPEPVLLASQCSNIVEDAVSLKVELTRRNLVRSVESLLENQQTDHVETFMVNDNVKTHSHCHGNVKLVEMPKRIK